MLRKREKLIYFIGALFIGCTLYAESNWNWKPKGISVAEVQEQYHQLISPERDSTDRDTTVHKMVTISLRKVGELFWQHDAEVML